MDKPNYDALKLENQLCFPLYACAKELVRHYKPYLDELDLTYTQYILMMQGTGPGTLSGFRHADAGPQEAGEKRLPHPQPLH